MVRSWMLLVLVGSAFFFLFLTATQPVRLKAERYLCQTNHKRFDERQAKRAWKEAVLKAHPDKGGNAQHLQWVQAAWEYLKQLCQWE